MAVKLFVFALALLALYTTAQRPNRLLFDWDPYSNDLKPFKHIVYKRPMESRDRARTGCSDGTDSTGTCLLPPNTPKPIEGTFGKEKRISSKLDILGLLSALSRDEAIGPDMYLAEFGDITEKKMNEHVLGPKRKSQATCD